MAAEDWQPESAGISKLEDLLTWEPERAPVDAFNKAAIPLPYSVVTEAREHRQHLLVCHDLKGGYAGDSHVQGGKDPSTYRLWDWGIVSSLVYFSHHLITIPPPCWTNAAHRNGVKVLGTFITEWDEGAATCKILLGSPDVLASTVHQLCRIAKYFGFDGWLINIENTVALEHVEALTQFTRELTSQMHDAVPGSFVIWYDSVTDEGKLEWQDALTDRNRCFFDAADAIFTNYSWIKEEETPAACASKAGSRATDVYMGVDVFVADGRSGLGFDCGRALRLAWEAGCSAALFAPAWVYETGQSPNFEAANCRLWEGIRRELPPQQSFPRQLPLYSNFDQGVGAGVWVEGCQVSDGGWNNLSSQALQPLWHKWPATTGRQLEGMSAEISFEEPYDGGACLRFVASRPLIACAALEIFRPKIKLRQTRLTVTYSARGALSIALALRLEGLKGCGSGPEGGGKSSRFILLERDRPPSHTVSPSGALPRIDVVSPLSDAVQRSPTLESSPTLKGVTTGPQSRKLLSRPPPATTSTEAWTQTVYEVGVAQETLVGVYACWWDPSSPAEDRPARIHHALEAAVAADSFKEGTAAGHSLEERESAAMEPQGRAGELSCGTEAQVQVSELSPGGLSGALGHVRIASADSESCAGHVALHSLVLTDPLWQLHPPPGDELQVSVTLSWRQGVTGVQFRDNNGALGRKQEQDTQAAAALPPDSTFLVSSQKGAPQHASCSGRCRVERYDVYALPLDVGHELGDAHADGASWVGCACVPAFRCHKLALPVGCRALVLFVQAKLECGARVPLREAARSPLLARPPSIRTD